MDNILGFSIPEEGPLSHADEYMPDFMELLAKGIHDSEKVLMNSSNIQNLFELKTRYTRNYLTFAGKNSKDFLLCISEPGVYNSPAVALELQTLPGKSGDLIRDNAKAGERCYKKLDISYDAFSLMLLAPHSCGEELAAFTRRVLPTLIKIS